MLDLRPFELRRAEELHRRRHVDALYRARMRDAAAPERGRRTMLLVLAALAIWAAVVLWVSVTGEGCGDVGAAPVALDGLAVWP